MTNEQVLQNRWSSVDHQLAIIQQKYFDLNLLTQDEIQSVFDSVKFSSQDLYVNADKITKAWLNRKIDKWNNDGLLKGSFGDKARAIRRRINVTNSEMLELLIWSCYIEENTQLSEILNPIFEEVVKETYNQGINDINPKKSCAITLPILYTIMNIPILGMTWDLYMEEMARAKSKELHKLALMNMQINDQLNITDYKNVLNKQRNRLICIDERVSGSLTDKITSLGNLGYLQAGKDTNAKQCKFIAEIDNRTTKMCETLDNQIFNIDNWNTFDRYSEIDGKNVIYKVFGLELGSNLPPINNHFHWCRSTITYQVELDIEYLRNIIYGNYKFNDDIDDILIKFDNLDNQKEHLMYYDLKTGKQIGTTFGGSKNQVSSSITTNMALRFKEENSVLAVHNHPSNSSFSLQDIITFNENKEIGILSLVNDDYVYLLSAKKNGKIIFNKNSLIDFKSDYRILEEKVIKENINLSKQEIKHRLNKEFFERQGWQYVRIQKNNIR